MFDFPDHPADAEPGESLFLELVLDAVALLLAGGLSMTFLPRKEVLSLEELHKLALGMIERGITKIRLTGGEPLVRRDMVELIAALGRKLGDGLEELTLTTNGTRLAEFAQAIAAAGVKRVNVSLDTLDAALFETLSRRDKLAQVLDGIAAAKAAGLKVKINTVALKGLNEGEIPDLVGWAHGQGHDLTLIEVMPLGEVEGQRYFSMEYVHGRLVLRLQNALDEQRLAAIGRDYADILNDGQFRQEAAIVGETPKPELAGFHRLTFHFNRRSLGRLRMLIDSINA